MHKVVPFAVGVLAFVPLVGAAADDDHVAVAPDQLKWMPAPPVFPKGAEVAVLSGDPSKDGLYVVRVRVPSGLKIPAHTHPNDENVTVISGTFNFGMGAKLDESKGTALKAGGFFKALKGMQHYAWCSEGTCVIQLHGMGPQTLIYVNPADDPRKSN